MGSLGLSELLFVLRSLQWTLILTAVGFVGGIVFGLLIALVRVSEIAALRWIAQAWISVFQGTPLLMQLFLVYYGLPLMGIVVPAWAAMSVALTAHASAYLGDIWRGSIQAVPLGQVESARALGLHYWARMFDVVLPQAFKISLPATVGFLVMLLKGTSLAAIVGFIELTRAGQIIANQTLQPLPVFALIGLVYFALCWPISILGRLAEIRLSQDRR